MASSEQDHRAGLVKVAIHQSLTKPMLFMGGERMLVILALLLSVYMGYLLCMRYSVVLGVGVGITGWASSLAVLRKMARADPQMWAVVLRARRYKPFYPAKGRFDASAPPLRDFK